MSNPFKNWIYYIYPKHCAICDTVIPHNLALCHECEEEIEFLEGKRCIRCGHKVKHCECTRFAYHFRGIVAPFANEGAAQMGIYNFKIEKNYDAAEYFGKAIADKVMELYHDIEFEAVTSVPMHRSKRKFTGFDHAAILARAVARELKIPYKTLLVKKHKNDPQHLLSARERFTNVRGAYAAHDNSYKNVLLIDDIKTTGATLDECSRRLMLAGTENVYCAAAVIGTCKDE